MNRFTPILICYLGCVGLREVHGNGHGTMATHNDVVKLAPRQANLTIALL